MTAPEQLSKRAFADRIGVKPSYVRQLEIDGRLVLTPNGRAVLVEASIARIEATRDPGKQAVAERHAAERGAPAATGHAVPLLDDGEDDAGELSGSALYNFQSSKAKKMHWEAEREQTAFRKEAGELMERSAVVAAFADAGATLRGQLEAWSTVLPPQLAGRDEAAVRATITDQVEQLLRDLSDKFSRATGEGSA